MIKDELRNLRLRFGLSGHRFLIRKNSGHRGWPSAKPVLSDAPPLRRDRFNAGSQRQFRNRIDPESLKNVLTQNEEIEAPVLSSIAIRIVAICLLTATFAAVFAMSCMAGKAAPADIIRRRRPGKSGYSQWQRLV